MLFWCRLVWVARIKNDLAQQCFCCTESHSSTRIVYENKCLDVFTKILQFCHDLVISTLIYTFFRTYASSMDGVYCFQKTIACWKRGAKALAGPNTQLEVPGKPTPRGNWTCSEGTKAVNWKSHVEPRSIDDVWRFKHRYFRVLWDLNSIKHPQRSLADDFSILVGDASINASLSSIFQPKFVDFRVFASQCCFTAIFVQIWEDFWSLNTKNHHRWSLAFNPGHEPMAGGRVSRRTWSFGMWHEKRRGLDFVG